MKLSLWQELVCKRRVPWPCNNDWLVWINTLDTACYNTFCCYHLALLTYIDLVFSKYCVVASSFLPFSQPSNSCKHIRYSLLEMLQFFLFKYFPLKTDLKNHVICHFRVSSNLLWCLPLLIISPIFHLFCMFFFLLSFLALYLLL